MIKDLTIFFTSIDEIKEALLDRCNSGNNRIINVATLSLDNFRNPQYNPQESKAVFWKPQNCSFIVMTFFSYNYIKTFKCSLFRYSFTRRL